MPTLLALLVIASQVHGDKVPLEALVTRSKSIVVAEPANPARREETLPLFEQPPKGDAGAQPRFTRTRRRYVVKEVLSGTEVKAGETIEVDDPNWQLWRAMSSSMEAGEPTPSPIIDQYQGSTFPEKAAPHLLFLVRRGAELSLTLDGAWETMANRKKVEAALTPVKK